MFKELKAKMEVIDMMKAQMDKGKTRTQEIEGDLSKANKGTIFSYHCTFFNFVLNPPYTELDEIRAEKALLEKKNETLNKVQYMILHNMWCIYLRNTGYYSV